MTELAYLKNTYLYESTAVFIEVKKSDQREAIVLNTTIFYPQGGGQPADIGEIVSRNAIFSVTDVRLDKEGIVWHFGVFKVGTFTESQEVALKIDQDRRVLNAKIHSAGHLLDCAVSKMGLDNLKPTKGFHFPDGPYVEYEGVIENSVDIITELEQLINELISQDLEIETNSLSSEAAKIQGVWAPSGKSARVVNFTGFPNCGCGGTHVRSSSEIGKIVIRKIKHKKGVTRIGYNLELLESS